MFTYTAGYGYNDYQDESFIPAFPVLDDPIAQGFCGDNPFCLHDFTVTQNQMFASGTLESNEQVVREIIDLDRGECLYR